MKDGSRLLLTPKDVREKGFESLRRKRKDWYDANEVDAFLDLVEQSIKELAQYPVQLLLDKRNLQAENARLRIALLQAESRAHAVSNRSLIRKLHQTQRKGHRS